MDMMMLVLTIVSLVVAAVSAGVAWRVTQAERVRSAARVAALAAAAKAAAEPDEALQDFRASVPEPVAVSAMFAEAPAASGSAGRQQWLMGAAGVFATVVVAFAVIGFVSSRAVHSVAAPQMAPLELVALSHNRVDGALAVAGLVRNPPAGTSVTGLEAEVRVFDAAGLLIGTRTAPVEIASLAPGQEAPFAVSLGELVTAARYRVSFRAAGSMRPHVDLRSNQPAAVTADAR